MSSLEFTNQFENIEIPHLGFIKIPAISIPDEEKVSLKLTPEATNEQFLYALARKGFNDKLKRGVIPQEKQKEYSERLRLEFDTIKSLYFIEYILLVYRIIQFCRQNNILNSPARGSCGGSLLLYCIDVIQIDPIKYGLLFERFISAARTEIKEVNGEKYLASSSLPDVDIDSDRALKPKVGEYISSLFPNRTALIATCNVFQSKSLLKEVLKCVELVSEEDAKHISDLVDSRFGKVDSLSDTILKSEVFKAWSLEHPVTFSVCCKLQGLVRNKSVHASGIIICNDVLDDCMPTELTSEKKVVTAYDMDYAQLIGIKIDNLGLKNLSAIKQCLDLIGKKMEDIDVEDKTIYQFLNLHNDHYYGIFQIEEGLGKQVTRRIKPMNNDDLTIAIAIGRPGSMSFLDEYIRFRESGEMREIDSRVADILNPTGNIIIFQEQIMALSGRMANFSPQERDGIRKAVGKKLVDKMLSYKEKFISQSIANKYKKEFVENIWNTFEESGNYLFNASHARGYSALTSITAYLKANYPLQYFLCLLVAAKNEQHIIQEISAIYREMEHFGIKLLPPSLSLSQTEFSIEGNGIRFGLSSIKGIDKKITEKLNSFKRQHANKFELFSCAKEAGLNIGTLSSFIQAGMLDSISTNRVLLVYEAQLWNILTDKEKKHVSNYSKGYGDNVGKTIKALVETIKDEKNKPIIKASRFETIKKNSERYKLIYNQNKISQDFANWWYMMERIGFTNDKRLIDIFRSKKQSLEPIVDILTSPEKTRADFIGRVDGTPKTGKSKNGNAYAKFQISDETGVIRVMIFTNKMEQCRSLNNGLPEEGDIVICCGTKVEGDTFFADIIASQQNCIYDRLSDLKDEK